MATSRSYGEACATAHALDLIGERWALLIVRELLLGPKRFTDLRRGMPHASPNRLAQRLRELEQVGVVKRRKLGPPSGAWVYELTAWGQQLEPVLVHLGRWGRRSPLRDLGAHISADSLMLALRSDFDPAAGGDLHATYTLGLGEDRFTVRVANGRLTVVRGEASKPDATVHTDPLTFAALLTRRQRLGEAARDGRLTLTGDADAVQRLLDAVPRPQPATLASGG